jgi:hypothetical protein
MKVVKDDVIQCGKWFIHGLNEGYELRPGNDVAQKQTLNFYNVAICDTENISDASWCVWDRVWKNTEKEDKRRILLMGYASEMASLLELSHYYVSSQNSSSGYDIEELLNKFK